VFTHPLQEAGVVVDHNDDLARWQRLSSDRRYRCDEVFPTILGIGTDDDRYIAFHLYHIPFHVTSFVGI
jgi:hypothetical protein